MIGGLRVVSARLPSTLFAGSVPFVSVRPAHWVFTLILLLGVQTAYVNPAVAAAELRAMACCKHNCQGPVSLPSARGCCKLTATASGPAERTATPSVGPLTVTSAVPSGTAATPPVSLEAVTRFVPVAGSDPPTFLAQRHLLL
jgi:hypothetical protein